MRSSNPVLSPEEVQVYLQDLPEKNYLLDGVEFGPTQIMLAIELAISEFNVISPHTSYDANNFPSKAILMNGTLYKLFHGEAALFARNNMSYSDGGLAIPIEERYQLYLDIASRYQAEFMKSAQAYKINVNYESGWGGVGTDYSNFPSW